MLPNCSFILFTLFLSICSVVNSGLTVIEVPKPAATKDPDWWKHGVFYQIYPRSFKDSDDDGIGDLNGITSKLNDLEEAGVTGIWLSPIYESGGIDQGYDISDFEKIDPEYGTEEDFERMVTEAHDRDIKVILDFVPNHSSNQHQWFEKSENNVTGYEDFYVWRNGKSGSSDQPPNNWLSVFHDSAWEWSEKRQQFYLHQFAKQQPDLNFVNPNVKVEMKKVLEFWLDKGVDGFRVDAVPYLFEDDQLRDEPPSGNPNAKPNEHESLEHIYTMDQNQTFDLIYELRAYIDQYNEEHPDVSPKILMSEAYTSIKNTMRYYGVDGKPGTHIPFNFLLVPHRKESGAIQIVNSINEWLDNMPEGQTANWVVGNHDNHRVATRFGPDLVDNINILVASLPGVMVTYNGEEIGQENGEVTYQQGVDPRGCKATPEDFPKVSRDFERTPYHWDDTSNAGFTGSEVEPWLPVSAKHMQTNLKVQKLNSRSHFGIYKSILKLRKKEKNGKVKVEALSDSIIKVTRSFNSDDFGSYVVLINIGEKDQEVRASEKEFQRYRVIYSTDDSVAVDEKMWAKDVKIAAHKTIVFKVVSRDVNFDWWKHAVIYQIYPISFKDSDNDGNGDLKGIMEKMPYLKDLGVDAIWLSPIYKSPKIDQGYDISNFIEIDEIYGTMKDFDKLMVSAELHEIKVIMDFVPNHSSDLHEWFIKSENEEAGYEDFYIWKDGVDGGPPNNWLSIFKGSAWTKSEKRGQYYLHQFEYRQPDLNYENPKVVEEMRAVLKFWLDKGVTGFRMDAVPYLVEDCRFLDEPRSNNLIAKDNEWKYLKHIYTSDVQGTFKVIYDWRDFLDEYSVEHGGDERIMMTEAYTDIFNTMYYYGNGERKGAHFTFNFQLIEGVNGESDAIDFTAMIKQWVDLIPENCTSNWVLGNHDKPRLATRFKPENLDGLNMLGAILPGVMVTYNAEEIGQENGEVSWEQGRDPNACNGNEEDFDKVSRDFQRTPFHWDNTTNAGFNTGAKPWLPVSKKYTETNLLFQMHQNRSHYELYKRLMKLRQSPAFVNGTFKVKSVTDYVLTCLRFHPTSDSYFHLLNLGNNTETFNLRNAYKESPAVLEVVETNDHETFPKGTSLNANNVTLLAHQSIIVALRPNATLPSSATIYCISSLVLLLSLLLNVINFNSG